MRYLTTTEVAAELRTSETAVRRALRRGRLRGIQLAPRGAWRVPADQLELARDGNEGEDQAA